MKINTNSALFKYYDNTLTERINFLPDGKEVTNICSLVTMLFVCTVVYVFVFAWLILFPSALGFGLDMFWSSFMFGNDRMFFHTTLMDTFNLYDEWTLPFMLIEFIGVIIAFPMSVAAIAFVVIGSIALPCIYFRNYIRNKKNENSDKEPNIFDVFVQRFSDFKNKTCTMIEYED